jgi:hypothetical protein
VLLELEFLAGRTAFATEHPDVDVHALLTY